MVVKAFQWVIYALALYLLAGCAVFTTPAVYRIGLIAPFEGRYSEVGYDLYYSTRLALKDAGFPHVELLAVDDGGTPETALLRAQALRQLPGVRGVLVAGYTATDEQVLAELAQTLPVFVVGHWGALSVHEQVYIMGNAQFDQAYTVSGRIDVYTAIEITTPLTGGDVFALKQFPLLREDLDGVTVITSGALMPAAFAERYAESDLFVPPGGVLVTLAYDAAGLLVGAIRDDLTLEAFHTRLTEQTYEGVSGEIRFEGGYWADAPLNRYVYVNGALMLEE